MSKRLSSDATDDFFFRRDEQNAIKTDIIVDFFKAYVPIVKHTAERARYVDIFAGRGYYEGCNWKHLTEHVDATPLVILRAIIANPDFAKNVLTWFNEGEPKYLNDLRAAASKLEGYGTIVHRPEFTNLDVHENSLSAIFNRVKVPTFAFVDPYGYKGLTQDLVAMLLKGWGCDVAFFFNYRRVNMGLGHGLFDAHFNKIFGEQSLAALRLAIQNTEDVEERESIVIRELRSVLHLIGADHVLTFRFRDANGRTSHHLIFASKSARGFSTMRNKMAKHSAKDSEDIPYFEFVAGNALKPSLFDTAVLMPPRHWPFSVRALADQIERECARGDSLRFEDFCARWLLREELPYESKHYRSALWKLQGAGKVRFQRKEGLRDIRRGDLPPDTTLIFGSADG